MDPTSRRECTTRDLLPPSRGHRRRYEKRLVRLQLVDLGVAQPRLAQHLLAIAADARRVAAELDLGLLEIERAGKGGDRAFGWMLAFGEEAAALESGIAQKLLERAYRQGGDVGLVERPQPLLGGAMLQEGIEHLVELAEMLGPLGAVGEALVLGQVGPVDDVEEGEPVRVGIGQRADIAVLGREGMAILVDDAVVAHGAAL